MPKGIYVRPKQLKKIIEKRETPLTGIDLSSIAKRIFNNENTQEDILVMGDKIAEFKRTDFYLLLTNAVEYVINTELDNVGSGSSDKTLGIQIGARRVLSTIMGLDKRAQILNKQLDLKRQQEKLDEEVLDPEEITPTRQGGVSI